MCLYPYYSSKLIAQYGIQTLPILQLFTLQPLSLLVIFKLLLLEFLVLLMGVMAKKQSLSEKALCFLIR